MIGRRSGPATRAAIQRVALELFTKKGYEATSLREIADELGIQKPSLYYHFKGKEDILRALLDERGDEAEQLLEWISRQPQRPELIRAAVLRWVQSFSAEKLRGIRFLSANPLVARTFEGRTDDRIGSTLNQLIDALAGLLPDRSPAKVLQLRMALLSINAAVDAATSTPFTDEDILAAANAGAIAQIDALLATG
ncbi:TetR family transcriptional regulator [Kribbella jejuensis]|uniref:TetR family transcriptional regulator n=2 Tax=Kribbella jejuensis TaxID=236068 RepID=A0A542E8H4_9ACTN|nr:TetR family transcriptional regulator [Kribbella jejuensis]